jgi:hypothetical protein
MAGQVSFSGGVGGVGGGKGGRVQGSGFRMGEGGRVQGSGFRMGGGGLPTLDNNNFIYECGRLQHFHG